jgi:hypothetical protein
MRSGIVDVTDEPFMTSDGELVFGECQSVEDGV